MDTDKHGILDKFNLTIFQDMYQIVAIFFSNSMGETRAHFFPLVSLSRQFSIYYGRLNSTEVQMDGTQSPPRLLHAASHLTYLAIYPIVKVLNARLLLLISSEPFRSIKITKVFWSVPKMSLVLVVH